MRWFRPCLKLSLLSLPFWIFLPSYPHLPVQAQESSLVVQGGSLIDVRTGRVTSNSVIVISGERIEAVGAAGEIQIPSGAQVIRADGKYILPGLWDAHVHTRDFDGILNINHGVTSTIDLGNPVDWINIMAEAREKQMSFGPRIFPQGQSIGGSLGPHQWNATTADEARWAARQNIEAGAAILKVYSSATLEMVRAVVEEADKAGLNVIGHGGKTDAREAILAGVDGFAHGTGIAAATTPPEIALRIKNRDPQLREELGGSLSTSNYLQDLSMFDDLIQLMVERNARYEPNFVQAFRLVYDQWDSFQLQNYRLIMMPDLRPHLPDMFLRMWATDFPYDPYPPGPEKLETLRKGYRNHQLFTRKFAAAGGKLLAGSDAYYHMISGLALWQEMEILEDAGVLPLQVLQSATINPAEYVHQDKELGTIENGKLADLIILKENPLEDIKNIRTLETVIQHGKIQELGYNLEYRNPIPRPYQRVNNSLTPPYISSVQPSAVPIGTKDLELLIKGRDFNRENRVLWEDRDLRVLSVSETELKALVPAELLLNAGTYKIHMITGGRVHKPSANFAEVMVTFGRRFNNRWNGQKMSIEF